MCVIYGQREIYLEQFSDVDMQKETRDFYRSFFGLTLSDEQIAAILNPKT
ncbi:hypothetical protein [Cedecea davisae]|nr:hypothetical protein [Cedecea davisae]